tara:strand:+ start:439 stop:1212 length:774 start_codon:yes stop_codon:yes gene_type:complete
MNVKHKLLTSVLAKPSKDIEAWLQKQKLGDDTDWITGHQTVYCISPYKTGTTYLSTSFDNGVSAHEPIQYLSMKELEKDFDAFFLKRLNGLNLKLECTGFFSAYIDELVSNPIGKDLVYICILRSPSSWITSVVNYWQSPFLQAQKYEYLTELFWKPKVGLDVRNILDSNGRLTDRKAIDKLVKFYFDFTANTKRLKNMHYVDVKQLDEFIPQVASLINEIPDTRKRWQRKAREKNFVFMDENIDLEYEKLIKNIDK